MKVALNTSERLKRLRAVLKKQKIQGLFVPRTDEYQGEYVPECSERLKWLSGFSGSWGTALIGPKRAALIVDGRYSIQANKEAPSFELLSPDNQSLANFLSTAFKRNSILGFDPWTTSIADAKRLYQIVESVGLKLATTNGNLVDQIWQDRPAPPKEDVYAHPLTYAGEPSSEKLEQLAASIKKQGCGAAVLTDPHSVAWALNIRGSDITHTPLALLRAVLHSNGKATVFAERSRFSKEAITSFGKHVKLVSPDKFQLALSDLAQTKSSTLLDLNSCPEAVRLLITKAKGAIKEAHDPCILPRARKNPVEQKGARNAQLRDGAALSNFLHWLSTTAPRGTLTEKGAQDELFKFRLATGKLKDLSFGSISASGPNAALPHYHVSGKTGRTLRNSEIYLIDSGGQYQDGTTDVTRTVIVGKPSDTMKHHYTLVLKGMIAVSMARFPIGTTGVQIDTLARAALWQQGLDFDHGTGHGVGSYLSVHEGPARISKASHVPLEPGMILSNEPGIYLKGKYGVRIENLLLVNKPAKFANGDRLMLSFETLTFAPIEKTLIDDRLMTRGEIQWLDAYHSAVWNKINTKVSPSTKEWLKAACAPLTKHT